MLLIGSILFLLFWRTLLQARRLSGPLLSGGVNENVLKKTWFIDRLIGKQHLLKGTLASLEAMATLSVVPQVHKSHMEPTTHTLTHTNIVPVCHFGNFTLTYLTPSCIPTGD